MPEPVTSERPGHDAGVPPRSDLDIDPRAGSIAVGGATVSFTPDDPDALLESYLRLVRRLREQQRADEVSLRRDEVERLAAHLGTSGESVLERLGTLMGATKAQRRVMAGLFIAGAMVITVAVPSVAALSGGSVDEVPSTSASTTLDAVADDSTVAPLTEPVVERWRAGPEPAETGGATPRSKIDVRNGPDGPGAISVDQLATVDPIDQPPAEPAPPADETLPEPEPSVDAAEPAPSAPPEPPPVAPAEPTVSDEAVEVAVGPPPEPDAPSVVVDPAPPPPTPPSPPPPLAPEPTPADEAIDVDRDAVVAVGAPPIPPADPPIVDPPGD